MTAWIHGLAKQAAEVFIAFLPSLVEASATLLLGWVLAYILKWVILRFGSGLDSLLSMVYRSVGHLPARPHWNLSRVVANVVFWLMLLVTLRAASQILGLEALAEWLRELAGYLPRLLIAGLILFIGYMLSGWVREVVVSIADVSGVTYAIHLGRMVTGFILAVALLLAMDQLGLDTSLLSNVITLGAAGIFGSAALAFGIGAGDSIRNIMSAHYIRKIYRAGQRVRLHDLEGEIIEMTHVPVLLETAAGSAVIPARIFSEQVSLILDEGDVSSAG